MSPVVCERPRTAALGAPRPLARRRRPWWRWLAASAVVHPGGGTAHLLVSLDDD